MSTGVQRQHVQVSALGEVEALHVGALMQLLSRRTSIPPQPFVERETYLVRADDESSAAVELSDSQWSNVRRAREQTRLSVHTENGTTYVCADSQYILYLPPSPPSANPTCAVRSVVLMEDLTPAPPTDVGSTLSIDPTTVLSVWPSQVSAHAQHKPNWPALVAGLNWTKNSETLRSGLRYVFVSPDPLVLNELRVYRAEETENANPDADPHRIYVRALSTFRSDVGAHVPKHAQDEAARALQSAQQHVQELQKALDAVVQLRRDA
ncbi:hypothetical protein MCUN1_003840 [Malassezia cuniculi]|uniref:Uncharacterized protein n=1 Tax=Malassezia cuniculi TaxID=948313 RepID=A0AAF0ETS4_9BASI|nr:hypothetical protein MCUN1_003840 [Malassezia cuniculi]